MILQIVMANKQRHNFSNIIDYIDKKIQFRYLVTHRIVS